MYMPLPLYMCNKLPCEQNPSSSSMFLPPAARAARLVKEHCLSHWCWLLSTPRSVQVEVTRAALP